MNGQDGKRIWQLSVLQNKKKPIPDDFAQKELGDIVYVELPPVGKKTEVMKPCATIEAVKTVVDVYAPFTGEVVEVNQELTSSPQLLNQDPYDRGWILKIKLAHPEEWEGLLSPNDYRQLIG